MGKREKILEQILSGKSDANIRFEDLRDLLLDLGFEERIKSSHHIFRKEGVEEKPNLQRDGNKAKTYQVKQVRNILRKYRLGEKK
ncbi:MAG: type II toxin-antitoxin system HicA family toxin [Pyrinomonadaceae bacterium]